MVMIKKLPKSSKEVGSLVSRAFRWVGVDLYGVTLFLQKPRIHKEYYKSSKKKRFFAYFEPKKGDEEPWEIFETSKADRAILGDDIFMNPKLYRVKLVVEEVEEQG